MSVYTDLVTSEHANRPRFIAALVAITQPLLDEQLIIASLTPAFSIDTAIGAQLDAVGLWVGVSRYIKVPIPNVYFSWDTVGVGWDEGYWKLGNDPTQGITMLPDEPYRLLLKATVALNYWDGSVAGARAAVDPLFPDNDVYISDNSDMTMTVVVTGPPLDIISAALLTGGYLAFKPAGVSISYVI